jgi:hypothetical protein
MSIEHFGLLSWFPEATDVPKRKDHAQDGEKLIATSDQHPAILPWSSCFGWRPSFRAFTGILPCPAAGLLLDFIEHDLFGKPAIQFSGSCSCA